MKNISLNNKKFIPFNNSENGEVNQSTIFKFTQIENLISAEYSGGTIVKGNIIGLLNHNSTMNLLYHCITIHNELRSGRALVDIFQENSGLLKLKMKWQWLDGDKSSGISEYKEIQE